MSDWFVAHREGLRQVNERLAKLAAEKMERPKWFKKFQQDTSE